MPSKQDDSVWERRLREYDLARASSDVIKAVAFEDMRADLAKVHAAGMRGLGRRTTQFCR